jgi:hypothetical protein
MVRPLRWAPDQRDKLAEILHFTCWLKIRRMFFLKFILPPYTLAGYQLTFLESIFRVYIGGDNTTIRRCQCKHVRRCFESKSVTKLNWYLVHYYLMLLVFMHVFMRFSWKSCM